MLPELLAQGLLDLSGGNFAVREANGIYATPADAGERLRWKITADDLVLFPGGSDASMSRGGRRPSPENRIHRSVLSARPEWNFSYHFHGWGLIAFCLAEQPLMLPEAHAQLIRRHKEVQIPVVHGSAMNMPLFVQAVSTAVNEHFADCEHGALLLAGHGPLIAGVEPETVLALAAGLENIARARIMQLQPPH
jgi:ribulose-5-phosphate 4-epimerase/fuculose-1-phosphate aldolase